LQAGGPLEQRTYWAYSGYCDNPWVNMMITTLNILLGLALFSVFVVLMTGVVSLAVGGEFNRKYANKLMQLRVATQACAVALLALRFFLPRWIS
jgi:Hypoxia induced protein conserved region